MGIHVTVSWDGALAKSAYQSRAVTGLRFAANHILTESNQTVPWDQGPLMRSGGVDVDERNLQASIYYDTPYARRQHEELGWRHKPGRRAKYLELTVKEEARTVNQIMAQAFRNESGA